MQRSEGKLGKPVGTFGLNPGLDYLHAEEKSFFSDPMQATICFTFHHDFPGLVLLIPLGWSIAVVDSACSSQGDDV